MVILYDDGVFKNVENEDRYIGIIVWLIDWCMLKRYYKFML